MNLKIFLIANLIILITVFIIHVFKFLYFILISQYDEDFLEFEDMIESVKEDIKKELKEEIKDELRDEFFNEK